MLLLGTGPADRRLLAALYAGSRPAWATVAQFFTFLGGSLFGLAVVVAGIALLLALRSKGAALGAFFLIAVGRLLDEGQKYAIDRPRPQIEPHLDAVTSPSFPSGHAANSMIVCLALALFLFGHTRWRTVAIAAALLLSFCIGVSRPMLGVHWPSDVVAGWSFGLLWVLLVLPPAERLAKRAGARLNLRR